MQHWARLTGIVAGVAAFSAFNLLRIHPATSGRKAAPAHDYEAGLARFTRLSGLDGDRVNPDCRTRLFTHGRRTDLAAVIFHGFSNCPHQFSSFAELLHKAGYNVLLVRLPRHGLERMAEDLAQVKVAELIATVDEAIDIAHGLGEKVTVMGLSAGGALAAWCGQNRGDVDRIVAVSPALGLAASSTWADRLYIALFSLLPNRFMWWDPELKEASPGPPHAYPRIATRAIGELMRLGKGVQIQSRSVPPAAPRALFVLNPNDDVVRNATASEVAANWRRQGMDVRVVEFPAAWNLPHDLIDPTQQEQQIDIVYPVLAALLLND